MVRQAQIVVRAHVENGCACRHADLGLLGAAQQALIFKKAAFSISLSFWAKKDSTFAYI